MYEWVGLLYVCVVIGYGGTLVAYSTKIAYDYSTYH